LLIEFSDAMGGAYVPAPGWRGFFGDKKLTITHPLGGCRIGTSAANGVVDEHDGVFDTSTAPTPPKRTRGCSWSVPR
jgi:choline dehydrogenase-like flavoprotein